MVDGHEMVTTGIEQQPQRQDSLADQVTDLHRVAVRLGMYDAADWLLRQTTPSGAHLVRRRREA